MTIGVKTEGEVRTDVGGDAAREPDQADRYRSACLCGAAITLRPVSEAEYVAELGDHDDDDDEPVDLLEDEDGAPFPDVVQRAHRWAVEAQLRELAGTFEISDRTVGDLVRLGLIEVAWSGVVLDGEVRNLPPLRNSQSGTRFTRGGQTGYRVSVTR